MLKTAEIQASIAEQTKAIESLTTQLSSGKSSSASETFIHKTISG